MTQQPQDMYEQTNDALYHKLLLRDMEIARLKAELANANDAAVTFADQRDELYAENKSLGEMLNAAERERDAAQRQIARHEQAIEAYRLQAECDTVKRQLREVLEVLNRLSDGDLYGITHGMSYDPLALLEQLRKASTPQDTSDDESEAEYMVREDREEYEQFKAGMGLEFIKRGTEK